MTPPAGFREGAKVRTHLAVEGCWAKNDILLVGQDDKGLFVWAICGRHYVQPQDWHDNFQLMPSQTPLTALAIGTGRHPEDDAHVVVLRKIRELTEGTAGDHTRAAWALGEIQKLCDEVL